jgi:hypothetical protein
VEDLLTPREELQVPTTKVAATAATVEQAVTVELEIQETFLVQAEAAAADVTLQLIPLQQEEPAG